MLARHFDAAKRTGRPTSKFQYVLTLDAILGLPARHGCNSVLVQFARGPKLIMSEEIDIPQENRGAPQVRWPNGCQIELVRLVQGVQGSEGIVVCVCCGMRR